MAENKTSDPNSIFLGGPDLPSEGGPASQTGGPKFGQPKGIKNRPKSSSWFKKHGSNILLPIIALCILIGGIYLYKNWPAEKGAPIEDQIAGLSEKVEETAAPEESEPEQPASTQQEEENEDRQEPKPTKPEPTGTEKVIATQEGMITVPAEKGEGITHLARQALKQYITDKGELADKLTKEHKIYVEDYLKDKKVAEREGNKIVEIDETISFEENLIKEAIDKSLELKPEQLKNLEKYSALVLSL